MMTLHKLTAGDGYTYLTRQVAAHDATERGYSSLGDYYAAKGESPGTWAGNGTAALGLSGEVTEQQMSNLFGGGLHPDAQRLEAEAIAALPRDMRLQEQMRRVNLAVRLGQPFRRMTVDSDWHDRLANRYQTWNREHQHDPSGPVPDSVREMLRTELADEIFTEQHGRAPRDMAERTGFLAQVSRPARSAVAGFDVTFSPVKSVSTLWAVAPIDVARQVEAAHHAAVASTLSWLEREAGYTRLGTNGVAQVLVRGLIMAQFTHRDSRAGDPDLHTHVAISNKVQTLDGRWLALDGRMLHRVTVAASEHYNTTLETELTTRLGVRFVDRGDLTGKRAVREIHGIDPQLNVRWASRRTQILTTRTALTQDFLARHGRLPTTVEMIRLSQQATLATREGKHEPRSHAEQRHTWAAEAAQTLGSHLHVEQMVQTALHPAPTMIAFQPVTDWLVDQLARATVEAVADGRATWREANLTAEAHRQVRQSGIDSTAAHDVVRRVVDRVLWPDLAVPIGVRDDFANATIPAELLRPDGTSIYTIAKGQLYTSRSVIDAEHRVLTIAGLGGARSVDRADVDIAALEWSANHRGRQLNPDQLALARHVATTDKVLQLALAPAGTGKTTVMGVLASAWTTSGGTVFGLAPQASAARELGDAMPGSVADTIDKLVHDTTQRGLADWAPWIHRIGPDSLVVIDEAGLACTRNLDAAITFITHRGGRVLLLGDDRQRAAIGAGGLLRDIQSIHGALTLHEVLRFSDPVEGSASLALRDGDPAAVGYWADHHRIHPVTPDTATNTVFDAWAKDVAAEADSIMIASTLELVTELNTRARQARLAAQPGPTGREVHLPNGETVSAGDIIVTKRNDRSQTLGGTDFVRNNDRWLITEVHDNGDLTATETRRQVTRRLPVTYIQAGWVRLGYAHTHASIQGITIGKANERRGTAHAIITASMTRNDLYPALTRATDGTHAYVVQGGDGDPHDITTPHATRPRTAVETLTAIIETDGTARSVTTEQREANDPILRLGPAAYAYQHAITQAAETHLGPTETRRIEAAAEQAVPGITDQPAWDTLRGHLLMIAAAGQDPIGRLADAVRSRELSTARDSAAVLDYRIDPTGNHSQPPGPLPWLIAIPPFARTQPEWAGYLTARAESVERLTEQVRQHVSEWDLSSAPRWATPYLTNLPLTTELTLWRTTHSVPGTDPRPAGATPHTIADIRRHRHLTDHAIDTAGGQDDANRWATTLAQHGIDLTHDDYWPTLVRQLHHAEQTGIDVDHVLQDIRHNPLPAEEPAATLYWRLDDKARLGGHPVGLGRDPRNWERVEASVYPEGSRPPHPRQLDPSHAINNRPPTAAFNAHEIES